MPVDLEKLTLAELCRSTANEVAAQLDLPEVTEHVLSFAIDMDPGMAAAGPSFIREFYGPNGAWNCHQTAERLFHLLKAAPEDASYQFQPSGSLEQQRREIVDPARSFIRTVIRALTDRERVVFEVTYANHAFVLVVRDGRLELLQSFMSRYSLGQDLLSNTPYGPKTIVALLIAMFGSGKVAQEAHELLFDATLEFNLKSQDGERLELRFRYRRARLATDDELSHRLRERMESNLRLYASVFRGHDSPVQ